MIIPFTRTPLRAFVVIPSDDPRRDWCRTLPGGWPIEGVDYRPCGPLDLVLRKLREDPRGLPVTVHPECIRRAAA